MKKPIPFHSGTFKSFDGTTIYYEVRGEGEPIVFIYGLACLINHWHFQIEHFSHRHQVIAFDIRGHHKSSVPKEMRNLSLEAIAKDIPYLFRELGLRQAHFAGHSFGAPILLETYKWAPQLIKSLVFINGFASNPMKGAFGMRVIEPVFNLIKANYNRSPEKFDYLWKKLVENPLSILGSGIVGGFNLNLTQLKDIEIYVRGVAKIPLNVFIPFFESMLRFEGEEIAAHVRVPTLIISGEKDLVTPAHYQEHLHTLIKNSLLVKVPYGSHCTQLDFPDYINLKMEKFLSEMREPAAKPANE